MAQIFDDLPDGRDELRAGVAQLEQAPVGGRGDLLDVLESLAVEKVVEPVVTGQGLQRRGELLQRGAAALDWVQLVAGPAADGRYSCGGHEPVSGIGGDAAEVSWER